MKSIDALMHAVCPPKPPPMEQDEVERRIRHSMRNEVCDLKVSYQVIGARAEGQPTILMYEHMCRNARAPFSCTSRTRSTVPVAPTPHG
jgi:hypothetical protein